jgi:hypothetical protein
MKMDTEVISSFYQRISSLLGFILFLNFLFFCPFAGVSFSLLGIGLFVLIISLFYEKKNSNKRKNLFLGVGLVILFSIINIITRSNPVVNFLSGVQIIFSLMVLTYTQAAGIKFVRSLMELVLLPANLGISYLKAGWKFIRFLFSPVIQKQVFSVKHKNRMPNLKAYLTGVILGLPVVALLLFLFSQADPVFAEFITRILTDEFLNQFPARIILSLVYFGLLSPLLFINRKKSFHSPLNFLVQVSFIKQMTVIMVMVGITVLSFLLVQWRYVFVNVSAETSLADFGVATFSEYVKKGFRELTQASVLIFSLIWAGLIVARSQKKEATKLLKAVQLVILTEFFVFIISIFRRVWLYQRFHGWTSARIYGGVFLFWLTGMAVFLGLRHFQEKRWVIWEIVLTSLVVFSMAFFPIDNLVVNNPPTVNNRVDYVYLSRLSADGRQGWINALDYAESVLSDPELRSKAQLNEEDRRRVAYSGLILTSLTEEYNQLAKVYLSEQEYWEYYRSVLEDLKRINQDYLSYYLEVLLPLRNIKETERDYIAQRLETRIKDIEEELAKDFSEEPPEIELMANNLPPKSVFGNGHYNNTLYSLRFHQKVEMYSNKDKLFLYNRSQKKAFNQLQEMNMSEKLLNLQQDFYQFHKQVEKMPSEQRDYNFDISLQSPLM